MSAREAKAGCSSIPQTLDVKSLQILRAILHNEIVYCLVTGETVLAPATSKIIHATCQYLFKNLRNNLLSKKHKIDILLFQGCYSVEVFVDHCRLNLILVTFITICHSLFSSFTSVYVD